MSRASWLLFLGGSNLGGQRLETKGEMTQAGRGGTSLEKQAWSVSCALRVSSTNLLMLTVMALSENQEKVLLNTFFKRSEDQLLH